MTNITTMLALAAVALSGLLWLYTDNQALQADNAALQAENEALRAAIEGTRDAQKALDDVRSRGGPQWLRETFEGE